MSKKNRDTEALIDIYHAAQEILAFTDGVSQQDLELNKEKRNATLYSIQIIGEATKRLSTEFRQTNAHIPWRQMAGMRYKIVHEYNNSPNLKICRDYCQILLHNLKQIASKLSASNILFGNPALSCWL